MIHIPQSKNLKYVRSYNPGSLASDVTEVTEEEGRELEKKTIDVANRRKGSETKYLEFSTPYFIPMYVITVTILASAGKLRRFRGGFDSTPSYTFCHNM